MILWLWDCCSCLLTISEGANISGFIVGQTVVKSYCPLWDSFNLITFSHCNFNSSNLKIFTCETFWCDCNEPAEQSESEMSLASCQTGWKAAPSTDPGTQINRNQHGYRGGFNFLIQLITHTHTAASNITHESWLWALSSLSLSGSSLDPQQGGESHELDIGPACN